jgi:signal transduction histidine kinase
MYWQGKGNFAIIKSDDLPTIQTDQDMVSKLLKGVLKRAIVRSPLGGQIRVDAKEINGKVYIDVSDEGAALTDTGVLRMFDKSIVDPAQGNAHPGSELAQAKNQLEKVGGQLWVGGRTRRGSTITICIPAVAQPLERRPVAG